MRKKVKKCDKKDVSKKNFKRIIDLQIILKLDTLEYRNFLSLSDYGKIISFFHIVKFSLFTISVA